MIPDELIRCAHFIQKGQAFCGGLAFFDSCQANPEMFLSPPGFACFIHISMT